MSPRARGNPIFWLAGETFDRSPACAGKSLLYVGHLE